MWRPDSLSNQTPLHCKLSIKERDACSQCCKMRIRRLQQPQLSLCAYMHSPCMTPYMHHMIPSDTLHLAGTLPESWADPGAFPALTSLTLDLSNVSGTLPPSWGSNGWCFAWDAFDDDSVRTKQAIQQLVGQFRPHVDVARMLVDLVTRLEVYRVLDATADAKQDTRMQCSFTASVMFKNISLFGEPKLSTVN